MEEVSTCTSTPNVMVYGELGRYPIDIDIKVRMFAYWSKLILGNQSKISSLLGECSSLKKRSYLRQWDFKVI
jgi:hypothetical protein